MKSLYQIGAGTIGDDAPAPKPRHPIQVGFWMGVGGILAALPLAIGRRLLKASGADYC